MRLIPPSVSGLEARSPFGIGEGEYSEEYSELFGEYGHPDDPTGKDRYTTEWEIPAEEGNTHSEGDDGRFGS